MNIISNHKSQLLCARGLKKCGICDELLIVKERNECFSKPKIQHE